MVKIILDSIPEEIELKETVTEGSVMQGIYNFTYVENEKHSDDQCILYKDKYGKMYAIIRKTTLIGLVDKGKRLGKSPYQSLKEAGFIKDPMNDFY